MGESFDHRPAGWIGESREWCIQSIHNHMVVDYLSMSSVEFWGFRLLCPSSCVLIVAP